MVRSLTKEQLERFKQIQAKKKPPVEVDRTGRKNLQAWVTFDVWYAAKEYTSRVGISMNTLMEQAMGLYLILDEAEKSKILLDKLGK
jgi:translation initiation factor 2 beta subunit (eIF-2beta)/eIF-5